MRRIFIIPIVLLFCFNSAHSQNGWLPPVNFPPGTNLCDPSPWQLVFYDGFDGNQLSDKWHTYLNWDGNETEDWPTARDSRDNGLYKDDNVFVSNGTCKILIKNEPYSWDCASCSPSQTRNRNITAGTICSYFHINGHPNYYNSGKFEARIKFPIESGTYCAFWVNHGGPVNEIDIAEAAGVNPSANQLPKTTYNLHAWRPNPNPYQLPNDVAIENTYPNQDWWNIIYGNWFNQSAWHTYTTIWDPSKIEFYVDHNFIKTIWKYYQYRYISGPRRHSINDPVYRYKVYPTCNPISGTWNITYAYPYSDHSECNIRLNTSMVSGYTGNPNAGVYEIGRMEVDYVKAWQRHPEDDGHENICNSDIQKPILTGPTQLCDFGQFVATPAISGGYWSTSPGTSIGSSGINGNGNAFANVDRTSYNWNTASGMVSYNYPKGQEGCPIGHVFKLFNCFTLPGHQFMVAHTLMGDFGQFQLFAPRNELSPDLNPTFEWNLMYVAGKSVDTQHYHAFGRFISTPIFQQDSEHQNYYLHWEVTATDTNGQTISESGIRASVTRMGRQENDTNVFYVDANVTDIDAYEQSVLEAVENTFMAPDADSATVLQMIEKIRIQKLAPYILPIEEEASRPAIAQISTDSTLSRIHRTNQDSVTKIFPNPASTVLNILPGNNFTANNKIRIEIYDIFGKLKEVIQKRYITGTKISFSISTLSAGTYFIEMRQDDCVEHYKFLKK